MRRRKWCYIQKPGVYDIACDKCGGVNITWSEYEGRIWCYDCEIDTEGFGGIFTGPIAMELSAMMGISFNRFYFASPGKMLKPVTAKDGKRIVWRQWSRAEQARFEKGET